jgi:choline-sulfatase
MKFPFVPSLCLSALLVSPLAAARPNIVFILADDQAPWALGASGHAQAHTPNMDRIAREGARFPNAFTPTPVCSPARASILTSRYGSELGITDWINPKADAGVGLDASLVTWPRLLQQAGYTTALFGKWHVGDTDEQHPTRRGYDTFMGFRGGGTPPKDPVLEKNGVSAKREGFIVNIVADEAISWLRQRDPAKPFAVSIHFREPHAAHLPVPEEDWAKFKDLDPAIPNPDFPGLDTARVKKITREYLAAIAALDRNLGHLLDALDALKLSANTIVIYTSDHGYNVGHHGLLFKGNAQWLLKKEAMPPGTPHVPAGQRPNMFDTSVKVPLAIRWPGVIKAGTVNPHTVSHLDWLPTFATLGAAPVPAGTLVRGRDLGPLLRGQAKQWDDTFYAEYSMKHGARVHLRMIRTPEWKLIRDFNHEGRDELYHLTADPGETRNRIDDSSPAARSAFAALDARLLAQMEKIKDPVLPQARSRLGSK